ncbi:MAG: TonB-dependent receptor [Bacteroidota bacterium]
MTKIATFTLLSICLPLFVLTQKIELSIQVTNRIDEKAVPFATVYITPCSCGGTTNEEGLLKENLTADTYQIITSSLGYQSDTAQLELKKATRLNIILNPQGYDLEQITVTGQDTRSNIERTQMGVQQLNASQIKVLPTAIGEVDVLRSLTMLPGVGSAGEASNGLSVRGGSLDQNLVLLDQAPIFNPTHLFGVFSVFTPDAIAGVELYKANMPARFGGRIASVVDLQVKNAPMDRFRLSGGLGFVSSRLAVEMPIIEDKLSALASIRVAHNDFLFKYIERLSNTKASFQDATVKLNWRASEKDNIQWTSFFSHDFYQLDINSNINSIAASSNQYDYSTFNNTLSWLHTFNSSTSLQTYLVNSDYKPQILFPQADVNNTIIYESGIQYRSLLTELTKNDGEQFSFSSGIQGIQNVLSPGALLPGQVESLEEARLENENGLELSSFADFEWNPSKRFAISGGLRYTQFLLLGATEEAQYADAFLSEIIDIQTFKSGELVKTYGGLEPRLGIRWKASEQTSIKASYAYTRQYLQNIYNSTTPLPTSRWKIADRYILPQAGHTYSLGYYQNLRDNQITFSAESYFRSVDNVLDYKSGADFFLQQFIEQDVVQGRGLSYGAELNLMFPKGTWNGWVNYTWSRSLRKFETEDIRSQINENQWFASDFDRPHVFNGTINFQANDFNIFSFNFTYQTGRPYTAANAVFEVDNVLVPVFLERNNARLPDYHRLDFSWRIHNASTDKEKRWKGDWIFTIYNLYGRKNAFNWYYGSTQNGRFGAVFGDSPLGAYQLSIFSTAMVSLGYSFKFE